MTHYLRNNGIETVVDVETNGTHDFSVVVDLKAFGAILLTSQINDQTSANPKKIGKKTTELIMDFYRMQELRGIYFEGELRGDKYETDFFKKMSANEFLAIELKKFAKKYNLTYVTD